jgi:hypothetical protein
MEPAAKSAALKELNWRFLSIYAKKRDFVPVLVPMGRLGRRYLVRRDDEN